MKANLTERALALTAAAGFCLALAGCGATADISSGAASSETATEESASAETAEDAYAYLADFDYEALFDDKGYIKGVTAKDYVTLPAGYEKMTLPADSRSVSAEQIDTYLNENILAAYMTTEQVTDRAAAMGDSVNIDYVGSIDGVEFEGGNSGGEGYDITLGSGTFIDDFEDQIAGHMPGETFDVEVTFPEDYGSEDLAGKDAVFVTTLHHINEQKAPALTDAWVAENLKDTYGFETVEGMRSYVKDFLLFNAQAGTLYTELSDKAVYADELPADVTAYFTDLYLSNLYRQAAAYGMTLETMTSLYGLDSVDALLESMQSSLEDSVKHQLLMQAVAEDLGIAADDKSLEENFSKFFVATDLEEVKQNLGANYVRANVLPDLVMQGLIANADSAAE